MLADISPMNEERRRYFNNCASAIDNNATTIAAATDVNFNSPGHRSSLDGSFIQDEDMHLILEFGPSKLSSIGMNEKILPSPSTTVAAAVVSESWRGRNAELASDFDTNVANLDFDEFSTGDMINLKDRRYIFDCSTYGGDRRATNLTTLNKLSNVIADCNQNNINRILMRNSLDLSLAFSAGAASLFSSIDTGADDDVDNSAASIIAEEATRNGAGFLSADSLNISSLSVHEENLKAACATKKREYMLTFDDAFQKSGRLSVADGNAFSMNAFEDAKLSDASSPLFNGSLKRDVTWTRFNVTNGSSAFSASGRCTSLRDLRKVSAVFSSCTVRRFLTDPALNRQKKNVTVLLALNSNSTPEKSNEFSRSNDFYGQNGSDEFGSDVSNSEVEVSRDDDYEYSEFYLNGRFIDVNHNEIGYVPPTPSSRMLPDVEEEQTTPQLKPTRTFATLLEEKNTERNSSPYFYNQRNAASTSYAVSALKNSSTQVPVYVVDHSVQTANAECDRFVTLVNTSTTNVDAAFTFAFGRAEPKSVGSCGHEQKSFTKDPKGFGTCEPKGTCSKFVLPTLSDYFPSDLNFLKFPFAVPALFPSVSPFPLSFLNGTSPVASTPKLEQSPASLPKLASPVDRHLDEHRFLATEVGTSGLPDPPRTKFCRCSTYDEEDVVDERSSSTCRRDSGFGSSGPLHIQDWESLATLLPKDVVQACSFFKVNSNLLHNNEKTLAKRVGGGECNKVSDCGRVQQQNGHRRRHRAGICRSAVTHDDVERRRRPCCCAPYTFGCCVAQRPFIPTCCCSQPNFHCQQQIAACCRGAMSSNTTQQHFQCSAVEEQFPGRGLRRFNVVSGDVSSETTSTSDDDDDEGDYRLPPYVRSTRSEYLMDRNDKNMYYGHQWNSDYSYFNEIPKFYSLQNVKELNDLYGKPVGYPLSKRMVERENKKSTKPCATCFRVRSPSEERKFHDFFCDCMTSDILEERTKCNGRTCRPPSSMALVVQPTDVAERTLRKINAEEKAAQKTKIYRQKQELVNRVVYVCDELISRLSQNRFDNMEKTGNARSLSGNALRSLYTGLKNIVADGLLPKRNVWVVVQASATLGPATKSIHELVSDLNSSELNAEQSSVKFSSFIRGLLELRSLDCWLSYLALKDKILLENYEENAFLRKAASAYKTLFNRLIMGVQPLSMMSFDFSLKERIDDEDDCRPRSNENRDVRVSFQLRRVDEEPLAKPKAFSLLPTRLPSDSRVPKSSSVPSKLVSCATTPKSKSVDSGLVIKAQMAKKSKIPLLKSSRSCSATNGRKSEGMATSFESESVVGLESSIFDETCEEFDDDRRFVCAIDSVVSSREGFLSFVKGETLILLDEMDSGYLRCRRKDSIGLVDRSKVTYVTFL